MAWKNELMNRPDAYISKEIADNIIQIGRNNRDKLLIQLLSRTGRRINEILELRVSDVQHDSNIITWNILKKRKPLRVSLPVDTDTIDMLVAYIKDKDLAGREYIFKSYGKTGHLTDRRVRYLLISYCKRLGINEVGGQAIHPHQFRHGFAIHFVRNMKRADQIFHLQKMLQHTDIRETMWYVDHFGQSEVRDILEDMWV